MHLLLSLTSLGKVKTIRLKSIEALASHNRLCGIAIAKRATRGVPVTARTGTLKENLPR
jgi:hypothetical protein